MQVFRSRPENRPMLPHSLRRQMHGLSGRLPGYVLLIGTILRRRSMPVAYSQALAQEAGFGRLPVRVPGRMLPGFRRLGSVAILGVILHLLLRQKGPRADKSGLIATGIDVNEVRDDALAVVAFARWVLAGVTGRRARLRSEV